MADTGDGLSAEERAAVKQRAKELREQSKGQKGEEAVRAAIEALEGTDQAIARKVDEIVRTHAPQLKPKTYYGMPAYANDAGKVVVFVQPASKFKVRYATVNFDTAANLDDGNMWAVGFAVLEIGPEEERTLVDLVKRAVS